MVDSKISPARQEAGHVISQRVSAITAWRLSLLYPRWGKRGSQESRFFRNFVFFFVCARELWNLLQLQSGARRFRGADPEARDAIRGESGPGMRGSKLV